jgi:transcriptional regulator with XRE-family HTH domain
MTIIDKAMRDAGLTQRELAAKTGISTGLIGRYLKGTVKVGLKNAPVLARALGLTEMQVLGLGGGVEGSVGEAA